MRLLSTLILLSLLAACAPPEAVTQEATPVRFVSGGLVFSLESPADGAVVAEPQAVLRGTANVEAILSLDGEIYLLSAGQPFTLPLALLEGPNAFGIVVSDYEGNLVEFVLTVIYEP